MPYKTLLDAQVAAANVANAYANELQPKLCNIFEPLIGKKMLKVGGGLMARYAALVVEVPEFSNSQFLSVRWDRSRYRLAWIVKTCEHSVSDHSDIQYASYYETTVPVGTLSDGFLTEINTQTILKADHNADNVRELRRLHCIATQAARDAGLLLDPFGE